MNTITERKSDTDLKADILSELKFEPGVKVTDIGVLVKDGVVTLNGYTSSYWEKIRAVKAAKRVGGVHAIADDIQIKLPPIWQRTDGDIAGDAQKQVELSPMIMPKTVNVTVREGRITLEGTVEWWYQKNAAEQAVKNLTGVKSVSNLVAIKPSLNVDGISTAIEAAFKRSAVLDADKITVTVSGRQVTLKGRVRNYQEQAEAERVAWAAPGVDMVHSELTRADWM